MSRILIAGGSGLVGRELTKMLIYRGHEVAWLSRTASNKKEIKIFTWDPSQEKIDPEALIFADVIVNLAGAGVADHRWTRSYKKEIYDSRVLSNRFLVQQLSEHPHQVKKFISASGTGIYGLHTGFNTPESTPPAGDFLARVCVDWEQSAFAAEKAGIKVVCIRTGVVLASGGGFIKSVSAPVKMYAGAPLGSGNQYISWIHISDLCGIYTKAIEDPDFTGVFNAVASGPVTNREITRRIADALKRPLILPPVPVFVLKVLLGQVTEVIVASQHVSAEKVIRAGYSFEYPHIDQAIKDVV